jgi:hypothetical protein
LKSANCLLVAHWVARETQLFGIAWLEVSIHFFAVLLLRVPHFHCGQGPCLPPFSPHVGDAAEGAGGGGGGGGGARESFSSVKTPIRRVARVEQVMDVRISLMNMTEK